MQFIFVLLLKKKQTKCANDDRGRCGFKKVKGKLDAAIPLLRLSLMRQKNTVANHTTVSDSSQDTITPRTSLMHPESFFPRITPVLRPHVCTKPPSFSKHIAFSLEPTLNVLRGGNRCVDAISSPGIVASTLGDHGHHGL